jgi:hypothetical protein
MKAWCGFTADHLEALDEGRSQASRANQAVLTVPKDRVVMETFITLSCRPACLFSHLLCLSRSLSFGRTTLASAKGKRDHVYR